MTVSRRKFFGLAGAAAVAGVAPGPIKLLAGLGAPPVAGAEMIENCYQLGVSLPDVDFCNGLIGNPGLATHPASSAAYVPKVGDMLFRTHMGMVVMDGAGKTHMLSTEWTVEPRKRRRI